MKFVSFRKSMAACAMLGATVVASDARADLLVHEGFDYAPGVYGLPHNDPLGGGPAGGIGFGANNWFGHVADLDFRITDGGPGGTYLDGAGGMNSPSNLWRTRKFDSSMGSTADGAVIWSSLTLSSGGELGAQINIEAASGHQQAILKLETGGTYTLLGGHGGSGGSDASSILASTQLGSPDLIVIKFENTANPGEMIASAWINPLAVTEGELAGPDMTVTFVSGSSRNLGGFTLAPGSARIDDLKVGDGYADVLTAAIPEPASIALLGLGGLLVLRRRR